MFTKSLTRYTRRKTNEVKVGRIKIGGKNKVCIQTMTNTPTSDITATALQVIKTYSAGAGIVRITAPGMRDVNHIKEIKEYILREGYDIPLVADIHFNQKIAFEAAKIVEKVRINPGNFADNKRFEQLSYSNEDYQHELDRVKQAFLPLLKICRENNTSLRIGTNHGSLSDRIMSRFGDTPEGMAESAMEFLRFCKEANFNQVIISMKASNTRIMVHATRLLIHKMALENLSFPVHLGVTEAGEGEDGRIKSAVGIGALLADGIGDTIRVSLTEPPENEIPVAKKLTKYFSEFSNHEYIEDFGDSPINFYEYSRRQSNEILNIGGNNIPVVIAQAISDDKSEPNADYYYDAKSGKINFKSDLQNGNQNDFHYIRYNHKINTEKPETEFVKLLCKEITQAALREIKLWKNKILLLESTNINKHADFRAAIFRLMNAGIQLPVIVKNIYYESDVEDFQIKSSADLGGIFIDGLADGIWLENEGEIAQKDIISTAFGILQATRMRMEKPDYISCPSCGRTLFDLQETTKKIRNKTLHLKGLKIGIMGCIVNGLGEMADADYGYIGAGIGKVNLYYNKELIKRGIPEDNAVEELVNLIKEKGDWEEPT